MNSNIEKKSFRQNLRLFNKKSKKDYSKSLSLMLGLKTDKDKNIKFKNFSELKSRVLEKHLSNSKRSLKQQRLNEIFDKDKRTNNTINFNKKFKELLNETYDINKNKGYYSFNKRSIRNNEVLNLKLISYLNKIKIDDKENIKNNYDKTFNSKFSIQKLTERDYNINNINNYYKNFYNKYKNTTIDKLKDLKKKMNKKMSIDFRLSIKKSKESIHKNNFSFFKENSKNKKLN